MTEAIVEGINLFLSEGGNNKIGDYSTEACRKALFKAIEIYKKEQQTKKRQDSKPCPECYPDHQDKDMENTKND